MCLKSPMTWTSTLVGRSTWPAGSCCLCYFCQAVRHHADLHPGRNVYLTSWFILSVLFLTHREMSVVPTCVRDLPSHRSPPWQECLPDQLVHSLCCFWQMVRHLWSLHGSWIPHHTHLHPSRNMYLTSWFILSVFFFDRWWDICGPLTCLGSLVTSTCTLVETSTWPASSFCLCCFWQAVKHLWSLHLSRIPITWTSTLVGMSTWPASSFCLCCFWQAVKHLWSLHMSRIPHHMDLYPCRNVCLTS